MVLTRSQMEHPDPTDNDYNKMSEDNSTKSGMEDQLSRETLPKKATTSSFALKSPTTSRQIVQTVRSTDGKTQVRGLLPGQQLVQMKVGLLKVIKVSYC